MTAFATHNDFATRIGVDLTAGEQTDVTALLTLASDIIRGETGQTISLVTDDEVTFRGRTGPRLTLPQRPVVEVSSVVLAGGAVSDSDWYVSGSDVIRVNWLTNQNNFGIGGAWGIPTDSLVVTYTHGFEAIPGIVKAVCLEMVVRVWVNPGQVMGEVHGSEQVTYQRGNGLLMTEDELRAVSQSISGKVGTIVLR